MYKVAKVASTTRRHERGREEYDVEYSLILKERNIQRSQRLALFSTSLLSSYQLLLLLQFLLCFSCVSFTLLLLFCSCWSPVTDFSCFRNEVIERDRGGERERHEIREHTMTRQGQISSSGKKRVQWTESIGNDDDSTSFYLACLVTCYLFPLLFYAFQIFHCRMPY